VEKPDIKKLLEITKADGGMAYGEEEFQQINEAQLLAYLRDGWQSLHKLNSGQVIIKR